MLNKLERFLRQYNMVQPGDSVVCAVSGGADSIALLFAMYLLRDKLKIAVSAAHFNHHLRGEESDRDEAFVRGFCERYDITLHVGEGQVTPGKKGLEAAAREARYSFLRKIPGKIATAHTADDNAETVLMHLIRGTGLRGLGGITPICGALIRPMLDISRQEVISFLEEYHLDYIQDSSNDTDAFLRNRLRHHVMPLLKAENPSVAHNVSAMALRLRQDEEVLSQLADGVQFDIPTLRCLSPAVRRRALSRFLEDSGISEPEAEHVLLAEKLVFSPKPSARASFPGGVVIGRNYDRLERVSEITIIEPLQLYCPSEIVLENLELRVIVEKAQSFVNTTEVFTVTTDEAIVLRARQPGDTMRLSGGEKELKKLFIDRKIPASVRNQIPVLSDSKGVLGVYGIGANRDRTATELPAVQIHFENL